MGSTGADSIINQMEQEMDDLQQMHYSTEYSTDINSKMQIPTRLSMGQPEDTSYTDSGSPDLDYVTNSPAHAMNVPERIMVAGSDTHIGSRQTPRHLDLEEMTPFPTADTVVGLTTPPHILKMEDVRFPTVGDQSVMKPNKGNVNQQRLANLDETPTGPAKLLGNSALAEGGPALDMQALQRHLHLLTRKVTTLEESSVRRDRRELLFCALGAVYFMYKGLRFLYRIF
ncbi:transport and Golgi organization protein 11-like [Acanthaster planci]|uniref:Mitochondrial fission factor n=1 Tax=Acanthaster planci TaxID=133434 RepID=A0A8B7XR92_ACAPL|nr:transport and Golgi organization protein 11-like [Acanthaster planci]XP_022083362.1 transport and Golgi organization protein 11-like [Acanthaster planci]XP_022083363.1 transport and Golgi organization protein 11-like [Acanthaster planci]XP_022083364.1 transport and Golgi organization protein 11-like [Acanthaster planci]XP_022083365.1 transport and Golgi organization protein 11-like [Acanthaster planci]